MQFKFVINPPFICYFFYPKVQICLRMTKTKVFAATDDAEVITRPHQINHCSQAENGEQTGTTPIDAGPLPPTEL